MLPNLIFECVYWPPKVRFFCLTFGVQFISPHGFRHTHATLMSEIGIDPSNTSKRLGHASSQVTLDVYTHTTKTGEKNSIDKFADYLNKAK